MTLDESESTDIRPEPPVNNGPPPWRASHALWLLLCLAAAALFWGRTASFEFEGADIDRLWEAQQLGAEPWQLLVKHPTVVSLEHNQTLLYQTTRLAWWAGWQTFGLDPFFFQAALGLFWAIPIMFVFLWLRGQGQTAGGVIAALLLLSMQAGWAPLMQKSHLLTLLPLSLQLMALLSLRRFLQLGSFISGILYFALLTAAVYADWMTTTLFIVVILVYCASERNASGSLRATMAAFSLMAAAAWLAYSDALKAPFAWAPPMLRSFEPDQGLWMNALSYPALELFDQRLMLVMTLLVIIAALCRRGLAGILALALAVPAMAGVYYACRYYEIPVPAAYALAAAASVNLLWLSRRGRMLSVPLTMFAILFLHGCLFAGEYTHFSMIYPAVALAWGLGAAFSSATAPGLAQVRYIRIRFRYGMHMIAALIGVAVAAVLLVQSFNHLNERSARAEASYHQPFKAITADLESDMTAFDTVMIDPVGQIERYAELVRATNEISLLVGVPDNQKTLLSERTGNLYAMEPVRHAPRIWIESPAGETLRFDPAYDPESWNTLKSIVEGTAYAEPGNGHFATVTWADGVSMIGKRGLTVTGWIRTNELTLSGLALELRAYDRVLIWEDVKLTHAAPPSPWIRFVAKAGDAFEMRTPERLAEKIELHGWVEPALDEHAVELQLHWVDLHWPKRP